MYNDTSENEARVRKNWNVLIFLAGVIVIFSVILLKLFSLQYVHYEENFQRSENNRLRKIELIADRGYIYDRNGNVLVRNRPSYQIALQAMEMPKKRADRDSVFKRLLNIHDSSGVRLFDSLSLDTAFQRIRWVRTRPVRILEDATMEQVAVIEEHSTELPGVSVITTTLQGNMVMWHKSPALRAVVYQLVAQQIGFQTTDTITLNTGLRNARKSIHRLHARRYRSRRHDRNRVVFGVNLKRDFNGSTSYNPKFGDSALKPLIITFFRDYNILKCYD